MTPLRRIVFVLILVGLGLALYLGARKARPVEGFYSGVVETTTYEMAFEVGGRLEAFSAEEGQVVPQGGALARLSEGDFQAALAAARAREGIAEAQLASLEAGSRPEEIAQAAARADRARAELSRLQNGATAEELDQARAQMEAAREGYQLRERGYRREDVASAKANVTAARSTLERAQADAERYRTLHREGAVPTRTYEEYENRYHVARSQYETAVQGYEKLARGYLPEERESARQDYLAREARYRELERGTRPELVEAARAELASAESALALVVEGPRSEDIRAARRKVQEARASVQSAELNLRKARLVAPAAGLVLSRNFEAGEMIQPGQPVLTLADLDAPWVEIFVPEPEIGQVRVGDTFEITIDSAPGVVFPGRVTRVYEKAEYTPKTIQTETQRVSLVYRVKVTVENPDQVLKPGMPADARKTLGAEAARPVASPSPGGSPGGR